MEKTKKEFEDILFIGLNEETLKLDKRIEKRVEQRLKNGFIGEIKGLLKKGVDWKSQSMQATGYRQMKGYMNGNRNLEEVVQDWSNAEKQYARRQTTWFKKDRRIVWFDVSNKDLEKSVEKLVGKWYSSNKD